MNCKETDLWNEETKSLTPNWIDFLDQTTIPIDGKLWGRVIIVDDIEHICTVMGTSSEDVIKQMAEVLRAYFTEPQF